MHEPDHAPIVTTRGVLFDLLMAVMNSLDVWSSAAGDRRAGLEWRDAVTARMRAAGSYVSYDRLVAAEAAGLGLGPTAASRLIDGWEGMDPWPDARAIAAVGLPYAFVTNSSARLARIAADRSGLEPRFTLSAEEAGWYKPRPEIYLEACRRLGSTPARTIFVAGSPFDAEGARRAGLVAWFVARRTDQDGPGAGVATARSLDEVVAQIDDPMRA